MKNTTEFHVSMNILHTTFISVSEVFKERKREKKLLTENFQLQ